MKLDEKTKNTLSLIARLLFSGLLLVFLFSRIDTEKTFRLLRDADLLMLAFAFLVFLVVNLILLYRWFVFIKALDLVVAGWNVFRYYFIGLFGNLFLPSAIGGDIIKILGLIKYTHKKPRVVASVLLDRLSGFASIAIIAICSFSFGHAYINNKSILLLIALMGLGSLGITSMLFNEPVYAFCSRIFDRLPRIKARLMEMHYDISLLRAKPQQGIKALLMACLGQITFILSFYLISKALHQDIEPIYFFVFVPLICIASAVPSIGGLGVREFGAASLFATVGVAKEIAVSMSLISFFFMVLVGLIGGVIYVFTVPAGRLQHHLSDPEPLQRES